MLARVYKNRISELIRLASSKFDYIVVWDDINIRYITSLSVNALERLFLLVIDTNKKEAYILSPSLEKERIYPIAEELGIHVLTYRDDEDPYKILAGIMKGGTTVAVESKIPYGIVNKFIKLLKIKEVGFVDKYLVGMRMVKDSYELNVLQRASEVNQEVIRFIIENLRPGKSEKSVSLDACAYAYEIGAESCLHPIIQSGVNTSLPHQASTDKIIGKDDIVLVDFTIVYDGYVSDITRTVALGESDRYLGVFNVVKEAQARALAKVAPGTYAREVDSAAREFIEEAGFGEYFIHRTGHGIGLEVHEEPYIHGGSNTTLRPGMAFTIEPGIYLPNSFGVRLEDNVVVSKTGYINLVRLARSLYIEDYK